MADRMRVTSLIGSFPPTRETADDYTPARRQVLGRHGTPLVIEPSPGQFRSDAGLLPIRQLDGKIGFTKAFADASGDSATRNGPSTPSWGWSAPAPTASSLCGGAMGLLFATEPLASQSPSRRLRAPVSSTHSNTTRDRMLPARRHERTLIQTHKPGALLPAPRDFPRHGSGVRWSEEECRLRILDTRRSGSPLEGLSPGCSNLQQNAWKNVLFLRSVRSVECCKVVNRLAFGQDASWPS